MLRNAGFKATSARIHLLGALTRAKEPLTTQALMRMVDSRMDQVTAYRILNALKERGLVRQIDFQHGHAHYEFADLHDDHHLVCINCERVEDFMGCPAQTLSKQILTKSSQFSAIKAHSFELFGICKSCSKS